MFTKVSLAFIRATFPQIQGFSRKILNQLLFSVFVFVITTRCLIRIVSVNIERVYKYFFSKNYFLLNEHSRETFQSESSIFGQISSVDFKIS